jgi:hypothetical protein
LITVPDDLVSPVRLRARIDPQESRWLWLVKWLLLIPHYFVLAFLWIAFFVMTVVAFFAIIFTGRYPAAIFDFNHGVLRWTWRVWFYGYGVLGTDRYPPFTLAEVPDYPATLSVRPPEQLSHWKPLVKWLLAIPHLILIGLFCGGGAEAANANDGNWGYGIGLIGLLVLFAAVGLLFTARYPRGIFDFLMGLHRWIYRTVAFVALMTDEYPPFRLDQGGEEPAPEPPTTPPADQGAAAAVPVPPTTVTEPPVPQTPVT